jgi:curved DNA-binding protein CbpA
MAILDEPGDLAEVPLAAVLIEALNARATGVLTVEHDGGASRVFLRDGIPVGAQSFTGFRPLGHALLADGLIDVGMLDASLAAMARTGKPQGEILVEMGAATRAQVADALTRQQAAYLTQIAALASGQFRFDAAAPVPPWTESIRIRPLAAILEALEKPQANALVIAALQPVAAGPIAVAPSYRRLADAFGFGAAEEALVGRLEAPVTLDAFFADAGVPPERARAILAALLLLGLAEGRGEAHDALDAVPGVVVDVADLAGSPLEVEVEEAPPSPPAASTAPSAPPPSEAGAGTAAAAPARSPLRRSDPEEARKRRQRLLQRAMQNMGVGPLSGNRPPSARAPAPAAVSASGSPAPSAAEAELRRALDAAEPRARSADLFERLALARGAGRDQVKSAYFQIAKQLHPDRFGSPALADLAPRVKELFAAVNEAYEVLSDDVRRAEYASRLPAASGEAPASEAERAQAAIDFQKAEACARTRDHARARGFFESALRADARPEYQAAYAWMLVTEGRPSDVARARALAHSALRDPACDRAALLCGMFARDDGDLERAERLFRQALARNPRNVEADRELRALARSRATRDQGSPTGRRWR